jgi:hypothetical protein
VDAAGEGIPGPILHGPFSPANVRSEPTGAHVANRALWSSVNDRPVPPDPMSPDAIAAGYRRLAGMTHPVSKSAGLY